MDTQEFINTLYGDADIGWLNLFHTPSRKTLWFRLQGPVPNPDLSENCYLGLGIRGQLPEDQTRRGKLEDVIGIPGLWLDLDWQSEGAHKKNDILPPDRAACASLLHTCPYAPTLIIESGHGLQAYWLFNEVWYFKDDTERDKASRLCRGWQQWFQEKGKSAGWDVDSTADLTRVFRIPGTKNIKTKPYRDVTVSKDSGPRFEPSDFDDFVSYDAIPISTAIRVDLTPKSIDIRKIDRLSDRVKYLILHGDTLGRYQSRSEAVFSAINGLIGVNREDDEIAGILLDPAYQLSEMPREKGERWLAHEIARVHQKAQITTSLAKDKFGGEVKELERPETLTELLAADIPEPKQIIEGFLHEGMLLFGGKSKRGKSWLMMDVALSVTLGRSAFRHFNIREPSPVLFLALEDGRRRIRGRAKQIQENLIKADNFHLLYDFPKLSEGGIEKLTQYIKKYEYKMIVIDVLAKLESTSKRSDTGEQGYHQVYDMFAPLQQLRNTYPFCLAMLTHLRKQDAEDVFDSLHGSVAYQGAQDVLWVLERKPKDNTAFLHIRDKDAEDRTLALQFTDGHWEFIGEGEEYTLDKERQAVLKVLHEEKRDLSINEIMKACGVPDAAYERFRKMLQRLVKDDMIHRTKNGRYSGTIRMIEEITDDMPF